MEAEDAQALWPIETSLDELEQLAQTAGAEVVGRLVQHSDKKNPASYLGKGKVQELASLKGKLEYDLVILDDELSPVQQRNIEQAVDARVIDRTGLILDIFARRAQTHDGRLQVELAQYEYLLPRLTGRWTHLERLGGGIGTRGPGETQLETDRRLIRRRIAHLKEQIEQVRKHRALYRRQRSEHGIPVVALVGYTNSGKSTLLNSLSSAGVLAENKLFATLDPTTRRLILPGNLEIVLTDTVGFIQKLPTFLVAAFKATLEELSEADILVHVLDITHPNAAAQAQTVEEVLKSLELQSKPTVVVLNKIDLLIESEAEVEKLSRNIGFVNGEQPGDMDIVAVSALRGWGLSGLLQKLAAVLEKQMVHIRVRIPYEDASLVNLFHQRGTITKEDYDSSGTIITGALPRYLASKFEPYRLSSHIGKSSETKTRQRSKRATSIG